MGTLVQCVSYVDLLLPLTLLYREYYTQASAVLTYIWTWTQAEGKDGEATPAVETQLGSPSPHVVIAIDTFGGPSLKVPFVGYNSGLGGVGGEGGFGFEKSEILDDDGGGDGEAAPVPVQELPRPR